MKKIGIIVVCFFTTLANAQVSDFQVSIPLSNGDRVQQDFRISADGERVYYTTGEGNNDSANKLYVASTSEVSPSTLLKTAPLDNPLGILISNESPNGDHISVILPNDAFRISRDGTEEVLVDDRFSSFPFIGPQFGQDSDTVFYATTIESDVNGISRQGLFKHDLSSDIGPVRLDTQDDGNASLDFGFFLTSDSNHLVYLSNNSQLFSVSANGGAPIRLDETGVTSFLAFGVDNFRISADGQRVVYRSFSPETGEANLFSVSITGENRVRLNINISLGSGIGALTPFEITPDSQNVVFVGQSGGAENHELFISPIATSQPRMLTDGSGSRAIPNLKFNVDGSEIIYQETQTGSESPQTRLFSQAIDQLVPRKTLSPESSFISATKLSNDGRYIAFIFTSTSVSPEVLQITNLETLQEHVIDSGDSEFESFTRNFDFSNESDFLIFIGQKNQSDSGTNELFAWPTAGGGPVKVSREFETSSGSLASVSRFAIPSSDNRVLYTANITRPFLAVDLFSADLSSIEIPDLEDENQICVPIKTNNGGFAVVCI